MKKTILSIAILASSILAYAGTSTNSKNTQAPATEQTATAKNVKDGKKAKGDKNAKGDKRSGKAAKADREKMLFSGITLTDAQKAKLDELKAKNKAAREAKKKEGKDRREGLTAEQKEKLRTEKAAERRAFLAEVKEILTPEQYATFLENNFVFNDKGHNKAHKAVSKKHDRKHVAAGDKAKKGRDKRRS